MDPAKTCANCRSWRCDEQTRARLGHRAVGTCPLGGPRPENGCSDCGPHETCDKWTEYKR